jgi:hypothetical protein
MSEFDKLKDEAGKYAQEHPEQVQKAEQKGKQEVGERLGLGGQADAGQSSPSGDAAGQGEGLSTPPDPDSEPPSDPSQEPQGDSPAGDGTGQAQ